ncbi:MAG: hypothetical protein JNM96_09190, partial [Bacteroidia bacterium]|nr:hypothetical protein [Bacteroidia bacterium]
MSLLFKITFFILFITSCKKQPLPEYTYSLERDNKQSVPAVLNTKVVATKYLYAIPGKSILLNTPVFCFINIERSFYGNDIIESSLTTESDLIVANSFLVYKNKKDNNLIMFELVYNAKHYVVELSKGFSNVVHDTRSLNFYTDFFLQPYKIFYSGKQINTDTISTCGNTVISTTDTLKTLKTCTGIANASKPQHYSINFTNYEHVIIENK